MVRIYSPNVDVKPTSARVNEKNHLELANLDVVELAARFGTPLWLVDKSTIDAAILAYKEGLKSYPDAKILYAGKAFLCLAMCQILQSEDVGLDVVSAGELFTAINAGFPADSIYLHGNNKSPTEIEMGLQYGNVKIVVDGSDDLELVAASAKKLGKSAQILLRVIPGVEPDTHHHIVTGHDDSKFGIPLEVLGQFVQRARSLQPHIEVLGLHAHIGSQAKEIEPYLEQIDILVQILAQLKTDFGIEFPQLDIGGGLGITYTERDKPVAIYDWSHAVAGQVKKCLQENGLSLPKLLVEPGRSIIGTAGITVYQAGNTKKLPSGVTYISVDGGMADNPRPITYQAEYTAAIANRMNTKPSKIPVTLAGRYCESGDILIKEIFLPAKTGDLIVVFGTGAYNYSMASNYNRTGRPACVLVDAGQADLIIERETNEDLLRKDRVPSWLKP